MNLRDNGLNVIIGVRKNGQSWKDAQQDGWIPGTNLFDVDEAISKGTIIMNLLSDAAQSETWPAIKPQLTKGKVRQDHDHYIRCDSNIVLDPYVLSELHLLLLCCISSLEHTLERLLFGHISTAQLPPKTFY